MGREENLAIFEDTSRMCNGNARLKESIRESVAGQRLILENQKVEEILPSLAENRDRYEKEAEIIVSKKRSFEAAEQYRGRKVGVHNFASATNPGGGVTKGSTAQEECLCRCSTLYFCLRTSEMMAAFYGPHRKEQNPLHNDDCILTPGVVVFKTDTASPQTRPEGEWYEVDMLTCAAPNLREKPNNQMNAGDGDVAVRISDRDLLTLHEKRLRRILDVAVAAGDEVVILGAFGCGAFQNNPEVVARAAATVIKDYLHSFETIEFAVYCSPRDTRNFEIFSRKF